jgi:hypothetical protein
MKVVIGRSGQIMFRPNEYTLADGEVLAYENDAILSDGQGVRVPLTLMDHDVPGPARDIASTHDAAARPYKWNGSGLLLRRPGFRPKTLLQDAATTEDVEALDAAKALNDGYARLHAQRAQQMAEEKERYNDVMYPRRPKAG